MIAETLLRPLLRTLDRVLLGIEYVENPVTKQRKPKNDAYQTVQGANEAEYDAERSNN